MSNDKKPSKSNKPASFGSILDEIGFKPLGRRIIIAPGPLRKPLKVKLRRRPKNVPEK